MPEVLELKPLKEKHLKLIIVESEFPIDWWFEVPENLREDLIWNLHLISKEYLDLIEELVKKYDVDFVLEERPNYMDDSGNILDPLKALFKEKNIPFTHADISENAQDYLSSALDEHRTMLKKLEKRIEEMIVTKGGIPAEDELFQRLLLWKEYLQSDYHQQEDEVRYNVREAWMMMNILNLAKTVEGKKLKGLFICDLRHFNGLEKLAGDLGVDTEQIKIKRSIRTIENEKELEENVEIELN
ncbi:MAG: hypothetical protein GF383_00115 [Candidatus Lokiarchaeota archaeon]|nr:hypothetical protein [Candidatus Lokiarchaeota archaeon]MBD3337498.1 hypothetical protein [Candidatus Lokiarchaeota archaeon]